MPPTPAPGKEGNFDGQISFLELFNYASLNTKTHVMRIRSLLQEPLLRGEIANWPWPCRRVPKDFPQDSTVTEPRKTIFLAVLSADPT